MFDLKLNVFKILDKEWAILVSGNEKPNPMTVSWGGFGTIWNKPVVTVYVRPTRYSHQLMMNHNEFTLNFFDKKFKNALEVCGSLSGRECDKWLEANLSIEQSSKIKTPQVKEAYLSFECKTIARVPFKKENFLIEEIDYFYDKFDYHTIFIGEVLEIKKK